ncbi:MAG: class I SAM-dependent methyltransferase [Bacteroidia bacterium]|nr:class I SAM-dependent methyltransferase [Bacteroidia bacterium]
MQRLKPDIEKLANLLESTDFINSGISDYSIEYLKKNHKSVKYSLYLALQLIKLGIVYTRKPINEITIAEIGGGTGFISILAKYIGIEKVIYSDIFQQSCNDFEIISKTIGLIPYKIICGSINELQTETNEQIDIIISRDVIEHIYDLNDFFKKSSLHFANSVHIHNTSANIYNLFKRKYFEKIHLTDEYKGYTELLKPNDSVLPFYLLRFDFIKQNYPELNILMAERLAKLCRGKNYSDIKVDVENFITNNILPIANTHPTNTCDPTNGNRSENLLYFKDYEKLIDNSVFNVSWKFAKYDVNENKILKKLIKYLLNFLIDISGKSARFITPAIIMVCYPKKLS